MGGRGFGSGGKYRGGWQRMGVPRGKTSRSQKVQQEQMEAIVTKLGLNEKQRRQLHDAISKMGYDFQEMLEVAKDMFGEKGDRK